MSKYTAIQAECRGCHRPILYITTQDGIRMQVDPDPIFIRTDKPKGRTCIVTKDGRVKWGHYVLEPTEELKPHLVVGRISHFATCPNAQEFRRRAEYRKGLDGR